MPWNSFEEEILRDGDILNIDITVIRDGYYGDTSRMFCIGNVSEKAKNLGTNRKSHVPGISAVKPGARLNDIGIAIENIFLNFSTVLCEILPDTALDLFFIPIL